ncbi:hypothetical protein DNHGIG_15130 [Collibacillus ludicampi]|uniref:LysM domain-containing protein n=1 Tax=Collibacillus ludicampi TaxID=2771369 RepID=A0AAV4LE75_9BACL|nr:LysM domain-containing protein [Collibacillus ludicampi]GIM45964.1 hypothetical protein DNHGIG_15130 [Collibacillus ludicampi]
MDQVKLRIGNFTFQLSPREELDFDFTRAIAKLDSVGSPTYQDIGIDEKTLKLQGALIGTDAWTQAELLETMMDNGVPLTLLFGPIQRTVRISALNPKLKRFDYVTYDMDLIIIPTKSSYQGDASPQSSSTLQTNTPAATSTESIRQYADKTVTIKQGDTLWGLAQKEYGRGDLWPVLAKINGVKNERALQIGQTLKIPSNSLIQKALDAYNNRISAIITDEGIAYLQTLEAKG